MKFALVNPAWSFEGSTYFGCREPHYPLELLFAAEHIKAAGDDAFVLDAQLNQFNIEDVRGRLRRFDPDFLVIPTAPSYLFWRCPPPELRVPQAWFSGLDSQAIFYLLSTQDISARLPSYIRLGKFHSKARIEWEQLSLVTARPEESERSLDFFLNAVDLPPA